MKNYDRRKIKVSNKNKREVSGKTKEKAFFLNMHISIVRDYGETREEE